MDPNSCIICYLNEPNKKTSIKIKPCRICFECIDNYNCTEDKWGETFLPILSSKQIKAGLCGYCKCDKLTTFESNLCKEHFKDFKYDLSNISELIEKTHVWILYHNADPYMKNPIDIKDLRVCHPQYDDLVFLRNYNFHIDYDDDNFVWYPIDDDKFCDVDGISPFLKIKFRGQTFRNVKSIDPIINLRPTKRLSYKIRNDIVYIWETDDEII